MTLDTTGITTGSDQNVGGDTIGGSTFVQALKILIGADGTDGGFVHSTNPLPTSLLGAHGDAFGRLRVSSPETAFDGQLQYDDHRITWLEDLDGSATSTHSSDAARVRLAVTASSSDAAVRQTCRYHRYQPGKSQLVFVTFGFTEAAQAGIDKKVGYFDSENGIFLEQNGTTALNVVQRSNVSGSVVDTKIAQASWNLDQLDGTGGSGKTLDMSKSQILAIDLQWLAVGRVRIGFVLTGEVVWAHQFDNANSVAGAYMSTANLPVRYEVDNTTGANTANLDCICASVQSEGGHRQAGAFPFSCDNGTTTIAVTTRRPILSIRPKSTFNSVTTRGLISPREFTAYTDSQDVLVELVWGGTLTGSSFSSVNADSLVEKDTSATAISGGVVLYSGYTKGALSSEIAEVAASMPMCLDIAGSHPTSPYTDSLSIVLTSMATSTDCAGALRWDEVR